MPRRFVLHQHLTVRSVRRKGADVHVVISDPDGGRRGIDWVFDDAEAAKERVAVIERWQRTATRLTYVAGNGESALVDDEQLFRMASAG
jgi:hypothetical protein